MAMYTYGKAPTTRTGSRWGSCTGSNHHLVGDGDLFNHQVGKIGKNSHRLKSAQERGSLEILFCSLVYHTCHQRACGRTTLCFTSQLFAYSSRQAVYFVS